MKTRTKKVTKTAPTKTEEADTTTSAPTLAPAVASPPHLFILPKDASSEARIVTLPNPATSSPNRYLVCPEKGFYEFTKIAAPKRACRSWLIAPNRAGQEEPQKSVATEAADEGYVLEKPEMFIATPVDPLFIALSLVVDGEQGSYLTFADYVYNTDKSGMDHLQQLLRQPSFAKLEGILERRMAAICDTLDMGGGEDKLYQLSTQKLLTELAAKAKRMVGKGLPASLEDRFVTQALEVPVLSIRREESSISIAADDANPGAESETPSAATSQDTNASTATNTSVSTAATSIATTPSEELEKEDLASGTTHLLRLRTALSFLQTSYIPPSLHNALTIALAAPTSPLNFTPLDSHLSQIAGMKKQAQALRSLSDNISRKRSVEEDEEAMEKAEAKKRKKDEEELKKKNMSRGVQQLKKADTSGMKKLSSFFTKATPTRTSPRKKG